MYLLSDRCSAGLCDMEAAIHRSACLQRLKLVAVPAIHGGSLVPGRGASTELRAPPAKKSARKNRTAVLVIIMWPVRE